MAVFISYPNEKLRIGSWHETFLLCHVCHFAVLTSVNTAQLAQSRNEKALYVVGVNVRHTICSVGTGAATWLAVL